ncbi:PREDICTED: bromodomain-containing protein DDB_G0280777-like [Ceratosolen solmsi marchali]|uniref:Bromodomain-containing protein DDB_G0280777-like n=1 Tax=Ceratosolen solmsi marchali TaxID=326594 RepID=A0AAJ6YKY0_9HYME|nr:PREDICTED: bromodomain-containing protein DDB_G0280777-like [Ceratosolen solmsi marchali]
MKSTITFVLLITGCLAQQEDAASAQQRQSRTPQGHIQYSDPDGLRVNWKLYAPYTQWKSHLEATPQRNERAETGSAQPIEETQSEVLKPEAAVSEDKLAQPLPHVQVHYKPYSMVPAHIKQLIHKMYEPQAPYVDPSVYIYRTFEQPQEEEAKSQVPTEEKEATRATSQIQLNNADELYEHIPKYESKYSLNKEKAAFVQYKDEPIPAASAIPRYGSVPERSESSYENDRQQTQQHSQQYQVQQPQQYQSEQTRQYEIQQPQTYQQNQMVQRQFQQPETYQQEQSRQYQQQQSQTKQHHQQQQEPERQKNGESAMPKELHQLLNLQAQTPYHVIANRILYKPKTIFVPKPIPEDVKGPYKYRSKIYFVKNENSDRKDKERSERDDKNEQQQEE